MNPSIPVLAQNSPDGNDTNLNLNWDNLTQAERQIVISVVYEGSPEEARKKLSVSHSTFYRKWGRLKAYYNDLIKDFPKRTGEILISQSIKAAQELGKELDSDNEKTRHAAATQILDRTLAKEPLETGYKRKITLEEWLGMPPRNSTTNSSEDTQF